MAERRALWDARGRCEKERRGLEGCTVGSMVGTSNGTA